MSLLQDLEGFYDKFHDKSLITNRFSYADFRMAMKKYGKGSFQEENLGQSIEGREIKSYTIGKGKIKILLWSQMHGNESTATRALLDVFQFFDQKILFQEEQDKLLNRLTIRIIPMLNPDGAERFQRRNAQGIDMNRDARALQAPESRMLKKAVDEFEPDFAFNLHDQRRMYNIKGTSKPSSISFLAPAYDESESINEVREKAMLLIAELNEYLQSFLPDSVGRYDDSFTYRAFGDNIQHWGSSTILVESGWIHNDLEKEAIRKYNFLLLMIAFDSIAGDRYNSFSQANYENIPMNDDKMFDILIRCAFHTVNGFRGMIDLGINRIENSISGTKNFYSKSLIEDLGDLSAHHGLESIDEAGLCVRQGKIYHEILDHMENLDALDVGSLLEEGILFVRVKNLPKEEYLEQPVNLVHESFKDADAHIDFEKPANLLLTTQSGEIMHIILNGHLINPDFISDNINGLVIR